MKLTPVANHFRNIVSRGPMVNNDEIVFYSVQEIVEVPISAGPNCRIIFSRPHYEEEGRVFSRENVKIDLFEDYQNHASELTKIVDGVYRFYNSLNVYSQRMSIFKSDVTAQGFIANELSVNYYDCMSGGMDSFCCAFIRILCERADVDKTHEVYTRYEKDANGDDVLLPITIRDFMNEHPLKEDYRPFLEIIPKLGF